MMKTIKSTQVGLLVIDSLSALKIKSLTSTAPSQTYIRESIKSIAGKSQVAVVITNQIDEENENYKDVDGLNLVGGESQVSLDNNGP